MLFVRNYHNDSMLGNDMCGVVFLEKLALTVQNKSIFGHNFSITF